jgi:hypothetical protein
LGVCVRATVRITFRALVALLATMKNKGFRMYPSLSFHTLIRADGDCRCGPSEDRRYERNVNGPASG